jgi:hypothetical protein
VHAALANPRVAVALAHTRWTSVTVSAVDGRIERVTFFEHGRAVSEVAIDARGRVSQVIEWRQMRLPYGDWIAYQPAVLVGLGALFVLMTGVAPWRRLRNLDVIAVLSLIAPVVLLERRYLEAAVLSAVPGLLYLLVRCAWTGLGPGAALGAGSTPLLTVLTSGLEPRQRVRLLRLLLIALVITFLMVGVSSGGAVDVVYAVMEGATRLVHGVLPYGHMPGDVIHGDTYPLLSYLLYVPVAWVAPVNSTWDSVDAGLLAAVAAVLAAAWALYRAHTGPRRSRTPEAEERGLRAALAWLAFPPLLITASTGTTDPALAAMLALAVLLWRRPAASTGLLAAAAWFKLAPAALLPIWLAPLRGRRLGAALAALAGVSLPLLGVLLLLGGPHGVQAMVHGLAYQFSRGSPMSVWRGAVARSLQPLAQASVLGLVAAAAVQLRRQPGLAEDRVRMAALSAAILLGLQLAADYWAFLYSVWLLPLLCLSLLERDGAVPEPAAVAVPEAAGVQPSVAPAG